MGIIGGLFSAKNDFQAGTHYIDDSDLAKRGFSPVQASGALQTGLNQVGGGLRMGNDASQMGLQGAQTGFAQSNAADAGQAGLATQLALRAAGKAGPSIAEQQLAQSMGQVQQQGAGSMAAARGVSPGTAARLISANQTNAAQQAAGQGAILRSQEQQAAENQLANVLAQRRQGALGQAQTGFGGFGAGQSANTANLGTVGAISQGQNNTAAQLSMSNQAAQIAADKINSGVAGENAKSANDFGSSIMGSAGAALAGPAAKMAHGGEVPGDERPESLAHHLMKSHKALSSAHEHLAKFASGGEVKHDSYAFPPMDVRAKGGKPKPQYVPENRLDVSPSSGQTVAEPGKEGTDSEGNKKVLKMAKGGEAKKPKPVYVPHEGPMDVSPTAGASTAQPGQEGTDSEGNKKVLKLAGGGLVGLAAHALGKLFHGDDSVEKANTEGGTQYEMNTDPSKGGTAYNPQYGSPGPDAGDESDTRGGNFASHLPVPAQLAPSQPLASPQQMATPGFGLPMYDTGGPVPGRAQVAGNSLKNDTVPAMLSPGEVVLPRTISHDPEAAAEFVRHLNARKMAAGGEVKGYAKVLQARRKSGGC